MESKEEVEYVKLSFDTRVSLEEYIAPILTLQCDTQDTNWKLEYDDKDKNMIACICSKNAKPFSARGFLDYFAEAGGSFDCIDDIMITESEKWLLIHINEKEGHVDLIFQRFKQ